MSRTFAARALALSLAAMAFDALARPLHYGAVDDPALAACDALEWRGDEAAEGCYEELLASDAAPRIRAEAAWALGDLHSANTLFQRAERDAPEDAALLTRWGDLFAATHQDAGAMDLYRDALAADAQYAYALLSSAKVLVGGFNDAANTYLESLLTNSTMPSGARAAAWLLVAGMALQNQEADEAEEHLEEAAALIEAGDHPPLELYALRATLDLVRGGDGQQWIDRALTEHPGWGEVYETAAYYHVMTRRYRDAIDLYQEAVDTDPDLASAHESMGVNLLRDNQVARARRHLETAHDLDPFSPVAVNTLRLLDSLSRFPIIQDPAEPTPGELPIVLRLHEDEAAAIAPYAIDMTREAIEQFTARYEFELSEPVVIEMYPDHEDFAVRTAGMPGIGILGATFGYVVAMDSPSAKSPDTFQWGTTLWHELAHVFTLEATDHLVPRWFSEGASVYEEWESGPTPGVRVPMGVFNALRDDKFLPVAILDQGFIRPTYDNQVIVSYMQAGLICRFIADRYGEDKLAALLRAFRDGDDTAAALRRVLNIAAPAFDRAFEDHLDQEYGDLLASLDDWHSLQSEAAAKVAADDWPGLIETANALLEIAPDYSEVDSAWLMLARAYREQDLAEDEFEALAAFYDAGGFEARALKRYAEVLEERGDTALAVDVLNTVVMVQPLDVPLHESLGALLIDSGEPERALQEFDIVLAQGGNDKANAHYQMARAYRMLGDEDATRDHLLKALDVAPGYRDAQRMLLDLMRGQTTN